MKRFASLALATALALSIGCSASVQTTEFKTVSAATAAVESARSAYQDLRLQCIAVPTTSTACPKVIAAHDSLMAAYIKYQGAVKALADANIAALQTGAAADAGTKVAAAGAGLIAVAQDFVALTAAAGSK